MSIYSAKKIFNLPDGIYGHNFEHIQPSDHLVRNPKCKFFFAGHIEVHGCPDGSANFGPVTAAAPGFPTDSSGMRGFSDHQAVPCWEMLHFFEGLAG